MLSQAAVRWPVLRTLILITGIFVLAICLTGLSSTVQRINVVKEACPLCPGAPFYRKVPTAGWPLPYFVDEAGSSAVGVLGAEDFVFYNFWLDLLFYAGLVSGMACLITACGFGKELWLASALLLGLSAGVVWSIWHTDVAVMTVARTYSLVLGGICLMVAVIISIATCAERRTRFIPTLRTWLVLLVVPGLICGWFIGGVFMGIILRG